MHQEWFPLSSPFALPPSDTHRVLPLIHFSVFRSIFHIWERTYNTCLSHSGLFRLTRWSPVDYSFQMEISNELHLEI
jgi:hypothetical protein